MENTNNESTLTVQGFTPYAQVPRWILRAGDGLSHGAVRLYGVIMTYADNNTRAAFPGRDKLGENLGVKEWSVSKYIKELEKFGALRVDRRRNKKTGNFYSNHYTLMFEDPSVQKPTPPAVQDHTVSTPTSLTTPTMNSTVEQSSTDTFHDGSSISRTKDQADNHLSAGTYFYLRGLLQKVGESILETGSFHDDQTQRHWDFFELSLEEFTEHLPYGDLIVDLTQNGKWTVTRKVADEYEAGKELTTLLNTARAM